MKKYYGWGALGYGVVLVALLGFGLLEPYVLSGRRADMNPQELYKASIGALCAAVGLASYWTQKLHKNEQRFLRNLSGVLCLALLLLALVCSSYDTLQEIPDELYRWGPILLFVGMAQLLFLWWKTPPLPSKENRGEMPLDAPFLINCLTQKTKSWNGIKQNL